MSKNKKSSGTKIDSPIHIFFRNYPVPGYFLKWLLISTCIGICIGSASAGFLQSLNWVTHYRENHQWLIALLPLGGLATGLLYHYRGKDIAAGNHLLLDTIHHPKKIIPFRMAPFVYLGTMITHLLGGSAGREGTALQMAGAIADQFSKPFRLTQEERKTLIMAAVAAGFGSVFGTPLAGAIFGIEVAFTGRLKYAAIFPALASAIIADSTTRLWQVPHTHYHISFIPDISLPVIIYVAIAGIAFGLCAALFSKSMHCVSKLFKAAITFPPLRPLVGGIIVALAVWAIDTTRYIGLGIPVIIDAFNQQLPVDDFALKMAFTIITIAAGFKGGEVTPLFFIGAALGSTLSLLIPLPAGLLAGMGFVAVFAGATNTPLACTIMAMELFGSEAGMYAAIACIVAYFISGKNSIYTTQCIKTPALKNHQDKDFNAL